jgi:hypothetical protein
MVEAACLFLCAQVNSRQGTIGAVSAGNKLQCKRKAANKIAVSDFA